MSWEAALDLELRHQEGRTRLVRRSHRGPLVVQRPFHPEGEVCHLYLVHPPGGLVSGDHLRLDVHAHAGAHALLTTPAATKFYRAREHGTARLVQNLVVDDATLEWLPQETLVFDGARAHAATRVRLSAQARFIGWEVLCLGRPASEELWTQGELRQDFELWRDDEPLLLDRLRLRPGDAPAAPWGFDGQTALGTLMAWPAEVADLEAARATSPPGRIACTLVDGVLLVRTLATQGETARRRLHQVWQQIRPRLLGREAHPPRIWST
jgi:urease accessory protein